MGSVKEYFSNLAGGIGTLLKGMAVTGKEFVTPKITEQYPDNRDNLPVADRFRAILTLKYDDQGNHKCIMCGTCERVCPNGTITLKGRIVETWDGKKKKKLDKYIYDLGSCTFCQLCVVNCPTDALEFSNDFEQSVFTRGKLVKQLNYLPEKEEPKPTPEQIAKLQAEKEAKLAAAKAAAEAKKSVAAQPAGKPAQAEEDYGFEIDEKGRKALAAVAGDPEKKAKILAALKAKAEKAKGANGQG